MLKQYRQQKGITQKEMAAKLDISEGGISLIESGKRGLSTETLGRFNDLDPEAFPLPDNRWWEHLGAR